ncbi:MAG: protoheme IX farnesyltransferase [Rhodobacterales bacterium CG15_BIG_FIL_POST_REV_8_21_14_020_59_13]|nr:MAG: protoheme IX farnesyltransferase [Rhodobacterales bacterium CG15_BIG_FIL_POST_REV_8_21_14_020_59_13]
MTEDQTPGTNETDTRPEGTEDTLTQQDFIKARNRRNVMIAWSLVAFMVLIFSITAIRLKQNMAARQDAAMAEQEAVSVVRDETHAEE